MKKTISVFLAISFILSLYAYSVSKAGIDSIRSALTLCASSLIPALFVSFVLSSYLVESGLGKYAGHLLQRLPLYRFGIPQSCAAAALLGFVCGFPVVAVYSNSLYEKNLCTKQQAQRTALLCSLPSFSFTVGYVGNVLFDSIATGIALYVIEIIASLTVGALLYSDKKEEMKVDTDRKISLLKPIVPSVVQSAQKCLTVCAFVCLFYTVAAFVSDIVKMPAVSMTAAIFLELSAACEKCASISGDFGVVISAVSLGFSGLCVACQICACMPFIEFGKYLLVKLCTAATAGVYAFLIFKTSVYISLPTVLIIFTASLILPRYFSPLPLKN